MSARVVQIEMKKEQRTSKAEDKTRSGIASLSGSKSPVDILLPGKTHDVSYAAVTTSKGLPQRVSHSR